MTDQADDEIKKQKDVAFYSASLAAWYTTKMEKDKSLFTLSAAAIGLLITLITSIDNVAVWIAGAAILCFIISSSTIIVIFEQNSKHIEDVLADHENPKSLGKLDKSAKWFFILGVVLSFIFALSSAYAKS